MAYTSLLYHVVFATKDRRNTIPEDLQPRIWAYMGGIALKNGFKVLAAGGVEDHVHLLLSLPANMPVAKAMQLIKAGSSNPTLHCKAKCPPQRARFYNGMEGHSRAAWNKGIRQIVSAVPSGLTHASDFSRHFMPGY